MSDGGGTFQESCPGSGSCGLSPLGPGLGRRCAPQAGLHLFTWTRARSGRSILGTGCTEGGPPLHGSSVRSDVKVDTRAVVSDKKGNGSAESCLGAPRPGETGALALLHPRWAMASPAKGPAGCRAPRSWPPQVVEVVAAIAPETHAMVLARVSRARGHRHSSAALRVAHTLSYVVWGCTFPCFLSGPLAGHPGPGRRPPPWSSWVPGERLT